MTKSEIKLGGMSFESRARNIISSLKATYAKLLTKADPEVPFGYGLLCFSFVFLLFFFLFFLVLSHAPCFPLWELRCPFH